MHYEIQGFGASSTSFSSHEQGARLEAVQPGGELVPIRDPPTFSWKISQLGNFPRNHTVWVGGLFKNSKLFVVQISYRHYLE